MNRPLALFSLTGFLGLAAAAPALAQGHDHGAMRRLRLAWTGDRRLLDVSRL